jgi:hypothetical protein
VDNTNIHRNININLAPPSTSTSAVHLIAAKIAECESYIRHCESYSGSGAIDEEKLKLLKEQCKGLIEQLHSLQSLRSEVSYSKDADTQVS